MHPLPTPPPTSGTGRPVRLAVLLLAFLGGGCGNGCSSSPAPVDGTAPVHEPEPAQAPPSDPLAGLKEAVADEGLDGATAAAKAFSLQMRQARNLADRAVTTQNPQHRVEAIEAYLVAAEQKPEDPVPLAEAGMLAQETGDPALAVRLLERCRERGPDSGAYWFFLGTYQHRFGDYESAIHAFEKAAASDYRKDAAKDRLFNSLWSLGITLIDRNRYDEALVVLQRVVELNPSHPKVSAAWYDLATAHRRLNQPREAERILRRLVKDFPSYAPAYGELGALLAEENRHDESLEWFEKSIRVDPGYSTGYMLLGAALTRDGRLEEAERNFDFYEANFPPSGQSQLERGRYWLEAKEPEKAIATFKNALALDPSQYRCHYYMAQAWQLLGNVEEARAAQERYTAADEAYKHAQDKHQEKMADAVPAPANPDGPK